MENRQEFTEKEWQRVSDNLQKQLGPEYLAQRPGPSGRPLTYIEGKTAINIANDIFGFNGWSSDIKDTTIDFVDVSADQKYSVGVSVTVRITLKDGSYHEDIGYGTDQNAKHKGAAFEKARKQAVTDATKRTLRYFGNALGNCLYDNPYLNGIGKMAKPTIKFTAKNLYRHSQFESKQTSPLQLPNENNATEQTTTTTPVTRPTVTTPVTRQITTTPITTTTPVQPKTVVKPENVSKAVITPKVESKSESVSPISDHYQSPALLQPIVPEDSFTYEGDDDFLVQVLAADNDEFTIEDDEFSDEMLAGFITSPSNISAPGSQANSYREATLSDLEEGHVNKKRRNQHI